VFEAGEPSRAESFQGRQRGWQRRSSLLGLVPHTSPVAVEPESRSLSPRRPLIGRHRRTLLRPKLAMDATRSGLETRWIRAASPPSTCRQTARIWPPCLVPHTSPVAVEPESRSLSPRRPLIGRHRRTPGSPSSLWTRLEAGWKPAGFAPRRLQAPAVKQQELASRSRARVTIALAATTSHRTAPPDSPSARSEARY
jgi:hypothetical protein